MTPVSSWAISVMGVLGLVLALHHLGVDISADIGTFLRSSEHWLAQPLF